MLGLRAQHGAATAITSGRSPRERIALYCASNCDQRH
jgi:hypothetical protein